MESAEPRTTASMDHQGGKQHGVNLGRMKDQLTDINKELFTEDLFKDVEDLEQKLAGYVEKFIQMDHDMDGVIGVMDMKKAMEDLGQAKTHLEVMKMIKEVDKENKDAINYREFVEMMLGAKTTVLKLVLLFEGKAKAVEGPTAPPPKRSLSSLP